MPPICFRLSLTESQRCPLRSTSPRRNIGKAVYRLEVSRSSHRQVGRLPTQIRERVNRVIAGLAENSRPPGAKKLTAREGYRIRMGDYRILYQIDDEAKVVTIYRVRSRGDAYQA
ncbi:MAG: type II toxin-antitoxin system RelE/ParE family toxin [Chloroflexi bacterium]|nr:type II toxin-antitoxin system RelE/ParE family toxin [Chloroflexota bacterium]